jgi:hypothetical protein
MMIEIQLTKGYVAIVDDEDADLAEFKWTALTTEQGKVYAIRTVGTSGKPNRKHFLLHRVILERIEKRELLKTEQ